MMQWIPKICFVILSDTRLEYRIFSWYSEGRGGGGGGGGRGERSIMVHIPGGLGAAPQGNFLKLGALIEFG